MIDEPVSSSLLDKFKKLIVKKTGLVFADRDSPKLRRTIIAQTVLHGYSHATQYFEMLSTFNPQSHKELLHLISELVNLESYFFRDKVQFELLKNTILPGLLKKNKSIRIWSAGCSTGEEPFSIAILLHLLLPDWDKREIAIFGTDISEQAISYAREGIFSDYALRSTPDSIKKKFFVHESDRWKLKETIRNSVTFFQHNLVADQYNIPGSELYALDLILCRNVFIYLDKSFVRNILEKFSQILVPEGFLLTGPGELYLINHPAFRQQSINGYLIYQKADLFQETLEPQG